MQKGLWQLLVESFNAVKGTLSLVLGVLLAVLPLVYLPSDSLLVRGLVAALALTLVVAFIVTITLLCALARLSRSAGGLPRVRYGRRPFDHTNAVLVCVADPSDLFSIGIWVAFFRVTEEDIQEPIGVGSVINVEDDKTTLQMDEVFTGHEDFVERVRSNDAVVLEKLRVKPYFSQQMFGSYGERR